MTNKTDMLKCENLSFWYEDENENKKIILNNIDLDIKRGSFTALLGRNGSGKSTLAKHFNAILLPEGGRVYAAGTDTREEAELFEIRKKVGMVFQNPDNQIVATTVEEDVAFGLENIGIEREEMIKRVKKALEAVDMCDFAKAQPHLLSGGQKQRVAIAGVIAMEPECIVLDEPTAMLDPKGRKEVMKTIGDLNKNLGITVVLITHYMEEAAKADRIVVMDDGSIAMDGAPKEIFANVEKLMSLGLDVPQVTLLAYNLKKIGIDLGENILRTKECAEAIDRLISERQNRVD